MPIWVRMPLIVDLENFKLVFRKYYVSCRIIDAKRNEPISFHAVVLAVMWSPQGRFPKLNKRESMVFAKPNPYLDLKTDF